MPFIPIQKKAQNGQDKNRIKYSKPAVSGKHTRVKKKLIIIMPKSNNVFPFFERCKKNRNKKKLNENRITVANDKKNSTK